MAAVKTVCNVRVQQLRPVNPSFSAAARSKGFGADARLTTSAAAVALCLAFAAQTAAAQGVPSDLSLDELIPQSAVDSPEEWAAQGVPADMQQPVPIVPADSLQPGELAGEESRVAAIAEPMPEVDVDSPLADLTVIDLPWPTDLELPEIAEVEPEEGIVFAELDEELPRVEMGSEERISKDLLLVFPTDESLFPVRTEFMARFRALSTIESLDDEGNIARLGAQARADEDLLNRLLQVYGYYDAQVLRTVSGVEAQESENDPDPGVRFDIIPGPLYHFGAIDLGNLAAARADYPLLRESFAIKTGDPLLQDAVEDEQAKLDVALGENGYPFAAITPPEILVDHDRQEGDLTLAVEPNGKYRFGKIISQNPDFMSSKHLSFIARFDEGDMYSRSREMDLRQAILSTGIVASTEVKLVEAKAPVGDEMGVVDVTVGMEKAPLRTIAGSLGYGTGEGFKAAASWEHRNLFPSEGMLRARGIIGTKEQLLGATFRKNNFRGRDRILSVDAFVSTIDYTAYEAHTVSLVSKYERLSNLLFQKKFSWSVGTELVATRERERGADGNLRPGETYFVGAVPLFGQFDTTDDLLDPTTGYRVSLRLSPETSRNDGVQSYYLRGQADASYYRSVTENVVLAGRVRFASIPGADIANIAPSRRLYAGGGGSVRGYGYRDIGPQNSEGDPSGGRSLTELSFEARIRTPLMGGAVGVVPFVDAGTVGSGSTPGFDEIKIGAGIGARYYTSFGPMRIDFAVPLNRGPNDSKFAVYVALGQSF